jgi:adenosylhomocysteine nucleosidase
MKSLSLLFLFLLLSLGATAQRTAILGALDQEIAILLDSLKEKNGVYPSSFEFCVGARCRF